MEQTPLVTICIPAYNAESSIRATLDSLMAQSYLNLKIKVFDNCSTDNTLEILKEYSSIEIELNQENIGAEGNFTRCIREGEGKYTAIFHSDDVYHPDMIREQVKILESNDKLVAVATHANNIDEKGKILGERFLPKELKGAPYTAINNSLFIDLLFKYGNFITCPSVMAKTEAYSNEIKIWNGSKYGSTADLDVWLRLTQIGELAFCSKPLINYRVAEVSYSFREKKIRTTGHPIFQILDETKEEGVLSEENTKYYDFLRLKDNAFITLNILKRKENQSYPELNPLEFKYIRIATHSMWHFKFYIAALGIYIIKRLKTVGSRT